MLVSEHHLFLVIKKQTIFESNLIVQNSIIMLFETFYSRVLKVVTTKQTDRKSCGMRGSKEGKSEV